MLAGSFAGFLRLHRILQQVADLVVGQDQRILIAAVLARRPSVELILFIQLAVLTDEIVIRNAVDLIRLRGFRQSRCVCKRFLLDILRFGHVCAACEAALDKANLSHLAVVRKWFDHGLFVIIVVRCQLEVLALLQIAGQVQRHTVALFVREILARAVVVARVRVVAPHVVLRQAHLRRRFQCQLRLGTRRCRVDVVARRRRRRTVCIHLHAVVDIRFRIGVSAVLRKTAAVRCGVVCDHPAQHGERAGVLIHRAADARSSVVRDLRAGANDHIAVAGLIDARAVSLCAVIADDDVFKHKLTCALIDRAAGDFRRIALDPYRIAARTAHNDRTAGHAECAGRIVRIGNRTAVVADFAAFDVCAAAARQNREVRTVIVKFTVTDIKVAAGVLHNTACVICGCCAAETVASHVVRDLAAADGCRAGACDVDCRAVLCVVARDLAAVHGKRTGFHIHRAAVFNRVALRDRAGFERHLAAVDDRNTAAVGCGMTGDLAFARRTRTDLFFGVVIFVVLFVHDGQRALHGQRPRDTGHRMPVQVQRRFHARRKGCVILRGIRHHDHFMAAVRILADIVERRLHRGECLVAYIRHDIRRMVQQRQRPVPRHGAVDLRVDDISVIFVQPSVDLILRRQLHIRCFYNVRLVRHCYIDILSQHCRVAVDRVVAQRIRVRAGLADGGRLFG